MTSRSATRPIARSVARSLSQFGSGGGAPSYDTDAQTYITAVEAADGQSLETGVKDAINAFVVGCKSDGIWTAIKASCILAGARTLTGALVPLVGTAPTNNNFVSGDYSRTAGLTGDGSTKYLDSGYAYPAGLQNNCHVSGYLSVVETVGLPVAGYGAATTANGTFLSSGFARLYNLSGSTFSPSDTTTVGFRGISRSSSLNFTYRRAGSNQTAAIASIVVAHEVQGIFARRREGGTYDNYSNAQLAFYSIGEALDLALLDTRVTNLITAIGAAIP